MPLDRDAIVRKKCAAKASAIAEKDRVTRECVDCGSQFVANRRSVVSHCCPCAVDRRRDYMRRLAGSGADPLYGYPRKDALQTREEISAYFDRERIECFLCGRSFKTLNTHLTRVHEVADLDTYRMMYGLPLSVGLVGTTTRERMEGIGYKLWRDHGGPDLTKMAVAAAKKFRDAGGAINQSSCKVITDEKRQRMKKMWETSPITGLEKSTLQNEMTTWPCKQCGAMIETSARSAIIYRCRLTCERCKYYNWSIAKKRWLDLHPGRSAEYHARFRINRKQKAASADAVALLKTK